MIGFGRVGQMVAQPLIAEGVPVTLLDHDADGVREAERFGARVHFGDGTRREVLHASGAHEARAIVVATDDPEATLAIVRMVRHAFPEPEFLVRAHDRRLVVANPERRSVFVEMINGRYQLEALLFAPPPAAEEVELHVAEAVAISLGGMSGANTGGAAAQRRSERTRFRDPRILGASASYCGCCTA